ncbi:phage tail tape measure protein [Haemophilus haemolyticus]|uniref:phage tail tape measure protein n=1 Tax=Haemophilus haemolyticus TaxID=726 RepID=UPI001126B754|nr:phage tail tape measure protein [Haemophilus haemolyticus]TPH03937.1 phage tail tape measure protein [Haemophilus haemolyticus]
MSAVQGLEYIISLTDQLSAPLKGVMKSIDDLGKRGADAMKNIGIGVAGIVGAGVALKSALDPAIEFSRAINEVKAAGIGASGLEKVEQFALDFSSSFGIASNEVVNSVNEIARAIDGLTDDELISFSKGSNILAKATGSSVQEMGSYLSTMYGIFQQEADRMGKSKWVEMMAGQATLTANMFKSSGESLSQAFTNLMSTGQSKGVELAEQFAVLGNLQSVMPGGMSGTKYAAFLNGVGKASKKLGLDFLDANNRMLPITDILSKIKKSYGDTIDEVEAQQLAKAFGTNDAVQVINYLLPKIDSLKDNIKEIGGVNNLDDAVRVSKITTDSWMRFSAILQNIKIAIGVEILKKIEPLFNRMADLGQEFVTWLKTYKNIARWIGYAVGALIGFTGLTAALTLMSGIISAIGVAFSFLASPIMLVTAAIVGLGIFIYKFRDEFMQFISGFIQGFKAAGVSLDPLFNAFSLVWEALKKIGATIWKIMGALSGASDSVYTFQQFGIDLGYALGVVFNTVLDAVELVAQAFNFVADVFSIVVNSIIDGWQTVLTLWDSSAPIDSFLKIGDALGNIFLNAFQGIVNAFVKMLNFIIEKANSLPGINIPLIPEWKDNPTAQALSPALATGVSDGSNFSLSDSLQPQLNSMPQGSVTKTLTQNRTEQRTVNYGGVTINSNNSEEIWQKLRNKEQLAAG